MQLHSFPRSQANIAGWFFKRRTRQRTNRTCHWMATGSVNTFNPSRPGGTNKRPLIQPVTKPTINFNPFRSARSARSPGNAPLTMVATRSLPQSRHPPEAASPKRNSYRIACTAPQELEWAENLAIEEKPAIPADRLCESCCKSASTTSWRQSDHMAVPAWEAQ